MKHSELTPEIKGRIPMSAQAFDSIQDDGMRQVLVAMAERILRADRRSLYVQQKTVQMMYELREALDSMPIDPSDTESFYLDSF